MGLLILSFLWGLAEATFFFLVPDIIITFLALHSYKAGFLACLVALIGAMTGGAFMYLWGEKDQIKARQFLLRIPAIQSKMLKEVEKSIVDKTILAMILGPTRGIPYKIYAVIAPKLNISLLTFLIVSIPARALRFVFASITASFLAITVPQMLPDFALYVGWAIVWIVIYTIYFSIHPIRGK